MPSEIGLPNFDKPRISPPKTYPVNKSAMNNRRFLIAAVFHFVHPEEKTVKNISVRGGGAGGAAAPPVGKKK